MKTSFYIIPLILGAIILPGWVYAIPTPDALIAAVSILPYLIALISGALISCFSAVKIRYNNLNSRRWKIIFVSGLLVFVISGVSILYFRGGEILKVLSSRLAPVISDFYSALILQLSQDINRVVYLLGLGDLFTLFLIGFSVKMLLSPLQYYESRTRFLIIDLKYFAKENFAFHFLQNPDYQKSLHAVLGLSRIFGLFFTLLTLFIFIPLHGSAALVVPSSSARFQVPMLLALIGSVMIVPRMAHKAALREESFVITGIIFLVFFNYLGNRLTQGGIVLINGALFAHLAIDLFSRWRRMEELNKLLLFTRESCTSVKRENKNYKLFTERAEKLAGKAEKLIAISDHALFRQCLRVKAPYSLLAGSDTDERQILNNLPRSETYILRSCLMSEDTRLESRAGQSLTLSEITKQNLSEAYKNLLESHAEKANVLIHPYIKTDLSGVLFTTSVNNPFLSQLEFHAGACGDLVSGRAECSIVYVGKTSGTLSSERALTAEEDQIVREIFLSGVILEQYFKYPQDIEWGYSRAHRKLYLFQSRDITTLNFSVELKNEQERGIKHITQRGRYANDTSIKKLRRAALYEVTSASSAFTRSVMQRAYAADGSYGRSCGYLGLLRSSESGLLELFSDLYEPVNYPPRLVRGPRAASGKSEFSKKEFSDRLELLFYEGFEFWNARSELADYQYDKLIAVANQKLVQLIDEVFPLVFYASVMAERDKKHSQSEGFNVSKEYSNALSVVGKLLKDSNSDFQTHFETDEAFRDMVLNCLGRFGYRSDDLYEISHKNFVEDKELFVREIGKFSHAETFGTVENQDLLWTDLRENVKDVSVIFLRSLRPVLTALAKRCQLPNEEEMFYLRLETIQEITNAISEMNFEEFRENLSRKIKLEKDRLEKIAEIRLGADLSLTDIEFLGTYSAKIDHELGDVKLKVVGHPLDAEGVLFPCDKDHYDQIPDGQPILLVEWLSPELYACFGKARAIVSRRGGMLSHLAILGREKKFPIYVGEEAYDYFRSEVVKGSSRVQICKDGTFKIVS